MKKRPMAEQWINAISKSFDTELAQGIKVETEHTSNKRTAEKIARDHLKEDPKYYTKLAGVGL